MRFALIRHDAAIAVAALRQLARRPRDGLTVLAALPLLALIARHALSGLPDTERELVAVGVSVLIAAVLARAVVERVWLHRSEGALAHFAQRRGEWLGYGLVLMLAGIGAGLGVVVAIGLWHPRAVMLGMGNGLAGGLALPFVREGVRRWWRDFAARRVRALPRPRHLLAIAACGSTAVGLLAAFWPQDAFLGAVVVGFYGAIVFVVTGRVAAEVVSYMTMMGHTAPALLRRWLAIQITLLWPMAGVLLLAQNWVAAGIAAVLALGLPIFTTLRILAYRAFGRLIADWAVAVLVLATAYAALTVPPLGPAVLIAAMIWLVRRGAGQRWLLA